MDTAAGGGQTQAERVYERYYTLISTITARILAGAGTAEDAEECTQDVLWEYLREPGKWDPERGSEQTYLCMLARSWAKSRRSRLLSRREEPLEDELTFTAPDELEAAAVRDALRRALAGLTVEERKLFTLRFVYQWSGREIGERLGLRQSAVTTRVERLRKRLGRLLEEQGIALEGKER